jgi:hypothetical protein
MKQLCQLQVFYNKQSASKVTKDGYWAKEMPSSWNIRLITTITKAHLILLWDNSLHFISSHPIITTLHLLCPVSNFFPLGLQTKMLYVSLISLTWNLPLCPIFCILLHIFKILFPKDPRPFHWQLEVHFSPRQNYVRAYIVCVHCILHAGKWLMGWSCPATALGKKNWKLLTAFG